MARAPVGQDELVELAAVVRAHGLRGELSLKPFNPESELLRELEQIVLKQPDGTTRSYAVRGARGHADQLILALEGVTDRNTSEALRGSLVCVPRSALPEPEEGEVYLVDLVGLEARDAQGAAFGRVEDIVQYPSIACLLVKGEGGAWEVPDTERYLVEIDVEAGFVVVDHLDELDVLHTKAD
ncbi:MAG: ribosome maturation factor RimM [Myxococcales bacterium]